MRAILTFHSIDESGSVLSFPQEKFRKLLEKANQADFPILDLEQLLSDRNSRGLSITFDDGFRSVLTHALPVLAEHDVPCHVFVLTDAIGNRMPWPETRRIRPDSEMLNWKDIELLAGGNVSIEAHTRSHPDMRGLTVSRIMDECDSADEVIVREVGRGPRFFAYPFGLHNGKVRDYIRKRYKAAVTTEMRELGRHEDNAALPRLDSYYLRPNWLLSNLDSAVARRYYRIRSGLRNLAGTQCRADTP